MMVVDNNLTITRAKLWKKHRSRAFPADLRYLFEGEAGKPAALNTGICRARRSNRVTDDDVTELNRLA
ncbi:MAG: hypothetical protein WKF84_04785 [Pyrinomonadaceae bacterium]